MYIYTFIVIIVYLSNYYRERISLCKILNEINCWNFGVKSDLTQIHLKII